MNYVKTVEFRGNLVTAFTVAAATLGAVGFSIDSRTDRTLELTGPGLSRTGCRQSLLTSVSRIRFDAAGGKLEMEAEFGGNRQWLVNVVPATIAGTCAMAIAFITVIKTDSTHRPMVNTEALIVPLVVVVAAAVAVPLRLRASRTRIHGALDALLVNMTAMGRDL